MASIDFLLLRGCSEPVETAQIWEDLLLIMLHLQVESLLLAQRLQLRWTVTVIMLILARFVWRLFLQPPTKRGIFFLLFESIAIHIYAIAMIEGHSRAIYNENVGSIPMNVACCMHRRIEWRRLILAIRRTLLLLLQLEFGRTVSALI